MRTIKQLLITVVVLLFSISASAYDFEVDGIYYNIVSITDLTVEVTDGDNDYYGKIVIPEDVTYKSKTLSVTSIGVSAFRDCSSLTSLTIPNSVTSIGDYAFNYCSSLTSLTIPNSVTSIGNYAFMDCSSLKELRLEDGTKILSLGHNHSRHGLFFDCSLETLYLGRNLLYEPHYHCESPFEYNKTLTSVTIGNSVTSIGDNAFNGCRSLTPLTIPNSVTSIGDNAFNGCRSLTSLTIPNSVTSIGDNAFKDCSSLKELRLEDGTKTLSLGHNDSDRGLFYDCSLETLYLGRNFSYKSDSYSKSPFKDNKTLTSVTIGNSVTSIGVNAFRDCSSLTSLTIPNSVTSIGDYAFLDCSSLTSVTIGNSVASIGKKAFEGCNALSELLIAATVPPTVDIGNFSNSNYINTVVKVPEGSLAAYQAANVWKNFWSIEEFVTGIEDVQMDTRNTTSSIYTLQGVQIKEAKENLPDGIYIQNGKKFIVK